MFLLLAFAVGLVLAGGPFGVPNCTQRYITQYIDHFNWAIPEGSSNGTYQMRYMTYDGFVKNGKIDTVFFYCGNEDAVDLYVNNTGFMWELGQKLNAYLVFAEHRYYGKSLPFPPRTPLCLNYLTTEQAMADYAYLISYLRSNITDGNHVPFIGFGGSYGGMLGSWFRMRYPDALDGVIAASAPIWNFMYLNPPFDYNAFYKIVTRDASAAGGATDYCSQNVAYAWPRIANLSQTTNGRSLLEKAFLTCQPLSTQQEAYGLISWAQDPWPDMAEGNYPYPSDYMTHGDGKPMVAWPIRAACEYLNKDLRSDDNSLFTGMRQAVAIYYNRTGVGLTCFYNGQAAELSPPRSVEFGSRLRPTKGLIDRSITDCKGTWGYQYCTEMVMPFASGVGQDMFYPPDPWNLTATTLNCQFSWNVTPRAEWATIGLPGSNLNENRFSNIVFSNGLLDPWSGGGVLQNISNSVLAFIIPNGAHHLDLMWSNPADPQDVISVRAMEENQIRNWIIQKRQTSLKTQN